MVSNSIEFLRDIYLAGCRSNDNTSEPIEGIAFIDKARFRADEIRRITCLS